MVVHPGKLCVVATSSPLQQAIQRAVGAKASKALSVRNLGVDFAGGRHCTQRKVQGLRVHKAGKTAIFKKTAAGGGSSRQACAHRPHTSPSMGVRDQWAFASLPPAVPADGQSGGEKDHERSVA